jgi:DNA invertase Pin-like site-specific DNA recombinase
MSFAADTGEAQRDDPDDPMRSALPKVIGVFAELERRTTVKRLRDGHAAKKAAAGKHVIGSYAYGTMGAAVARIGVLRADGRSYQGSCVLVS